jgi:hypothetical protein
MTFVIPAKAGIQGSDWIPPAYHVPGQACQARDDNSDASFRIRLVGVIRRTLWLSLSCIDVTRDP